MTAKTPPDPFSSAVRLLARRPYSVAELRRVLRRKFGEDARIQEAITRLRELRFLDDRKFAAQHASFLARHRGFGTERIRRDLEIKRVDDAVIEAALQHTLEETSEQERLERALDKKLRGLTLPLAPRKFFSLCQGLRRLGFPSDAIMKTMRSRPELKPIAEKMEE